MRRRKLKAASASDSVAAVLGNDDLLREILVRLDHPTCLVHAALVSRRWLRHASDPAFLRRFGGLHPPRLLGLYVVGLGDNPCRFVPLPHPRELDVVFRRASFQLGHGIVLDCRNGRALVIRSCHEMDVCSPLHRTPHTRLPWPVQAAIQASDFFFLEDGGDDMCYITLVGNDKKISAQHFVVGVAGASEVRTSATIETPSQWRSYKDPALFVNKKFYYLGKDGYILGLDVASMCLRIINLPDGVEQNANHRNMVLSGANGAGFHLINLKGFEILVWNHDDTDTDDTGGWQLVDTICVRQAIAHLAKPDYWESTLKFGTGRLHRVADRAEFLLNLGREFFRMHIGGRKVEKVFERPPDDDSFYQNSVVQPIMMVWPPRFPTLSDEQVHQGQDG